MKLEALRERFQGWGNNLWRWFRGLPGWLRIGVVVFLVVYAAGLGVAYNYTENNPNFCRSCHTMINAWARWKTSEHSKVNCHDCHRQSKVDSLEQLAKYLAQRPDTVSKHAEVPDRVCAKCHESGNPAWIQVINTAGHRVHAEQKGIPCTTCHSTSLHRFHPTTQLCATCHGDHVTGDKAIKVHGMDEFQCLTCHDFLRENSPLRPVRESCLDCHTRLLKQTRVTWPAGAPMQFPCGQCHKPHLKAEPIVDCQACHGNIPQQGLHAGKGHAPASCLSCHQPHRWKVDSRQPCLACHADRKDHQGEWPCAMCHSFSRG